MLWRVLWALLLHFMLGERAFSHSQWSCLLGGWLNPAEELLTSETALTWSFEMICPSPSVFTAVMLSAIMSSYKVTLASYSVPPLRQKMKVLLFFFFPQYNFNLPRHSSIQTGFFFPIFKSFYTIFFAWNIFISIDLDSYFALFLVTILLLCCSPVFLCWACR